MTGRWTPEEDAALREHYPAHGTAWPGWAAVLPGRSEWGRRERAYKLGVTGTRGPRPGDRGARPPRPSTCGECRFYREGGTPGRGRCTERHARGMFAESPAVRAHYDAGTCEHGEVGT